MQQAPTNQRKGPERLPTEDLDRLLEAQIIVAWAGEGGEEPRLGWWKTDMMSEFGGEDLFQRLLPQTWEWAVIQAAREAARRHDAQLRAKVHDPDTLVSLYRLGFTLDERVDERVQELKRSGVSPKEAFPALRGLMSQDWDRGRFLDWVQDHGIAEFDAAPAGRQLKGSPPDALAETVDRLIAALAPLSDQYPLPYFRRPR